MSESPVPLPEGFSWGFVIGRFIRAKADTTNDPDRFPEAEGSTGRVTFTPRLKLSKHLTNPTAFVQYENVQAKIVNGVLVDAQEEEGIYLISGVYDVTFTLESGTIPGFPIEIGPQHTIQNPYDLVQEAPYVAPPGTVVHSTPLPPGALDNQYLAYRNGRLVWVDGVGSVDTTNLAKVTGGPLTIHMDQVYISINQIPNDGDGHAYWLAEVP